MRTTVWRHVMSTVSIATDGDQWGCTTGRPTSATPPAHPPTDHWRRELRDEDASDRTRCGERRDGSGVIRRDGVRTFRTTPFIRLEHDSYPISGGTGGGRTKS